MRAVLSCRPATLLLGLLSLLALGGCEGRAFTPGAGPVPAAGPMALGASPNPAVQAAMAQVGAAGASGSDIVSSGDVLEVSFFLVNAPQRVSAYQVQPGDTLRVDVAEHPELSRDAVLVLPDGTISLPLIGTIPVAGRTVQSLSQRVLSRYQGRQIITPGVTVSVERTRASETEAQVGAMGGGNTVRVPVFRGQSVELPYIRPIPVDRPLEAIRRDIQQAYYEQFGPRVRVTVNLAERRERTVQAYVMGSVRNPGPVDLKPDMTALMAIAAAGGLAEDANRRGITLVRLRPDGAYDYLPLSLATTPGAGDYGASAVPLQPNDVIVVERRTLFRAQ